jgi:hypothetical protein
VPSPHTCTRLLPVDLEAALPEQACPGRRRNLEGRQTAPLSALACSAPPLGRERWRVRLFADRAVEVGLVEALSSAPGRR